MKIKNIYLEYVYYPTYRLIIKIIELPRKIRWFVQRGIRGYAVCDTWSFDTYLAKIISGGLKELAKRELAYPIEDKDHKKWIDTLNRIADEFERYDDDAFEDFENHKKWLKENNKKQKEFNKAFDDLQKHFGDLWD